MIGLALSVLLLAPAQQAPAATIVGDWIVAPATADSCAAVTGYGPNLMVSIREDAAGVGEFFLSDERWKLQEGATQAGTLSWDGWKTSRETRFVARRTAQGRWVLAASTESGFTETLAGAKHFWVRIPSVGFDDDFAVPDALDLVTAIASCNRDL